MKTLIKIVKSLHLYFVSGSLPSKMRIKDVIEFCEWSKKAEWRNDAGVKRMFINNDWENYYRFQYAWERITEVNESEINIISNYNLEQNYPNPFNPSTTIKYSIPENSLVKIDIINTLGQRVDILFDDIISVGNHEVIWNALDLPSGLYMYRLSAISLESRKEFQSVKKMVLIK